MLECLSYLQCLEHFKLLERSALFQNNNLKHFKLEKQKKNKKYKIDSLYTSYEPNLITISQTFLNIPITSRLNELTIFNFQ